MKQTVRHMTPLAVLLVMAFGWIVMQFPGGSSAAVVANLKMPADGTGLIAAFEDAEGATDQRVDFQAALYVPADQPATPFLAPGPFNATWRGQLNVPMRDRYHFAFEGSGTFTLTINGEVVLSVEDAQAGERIISGPVRLDQGPNEIVAQYASPSSADAAVRLLWSSPDFPLEPVSPSVFTYDQSHGNDDALHERQQVRQGRALMAEHRCIRCHTAPNGLIGDASMPELMMDAPAIMDVGLRLHEPWMAEWIADPEAVRHDATMPKFFHGEAGEQQAKDVAAYLATLRFGAVAEASTPVPSDADTIEAGGHLYASLGCVGCHELRDQEPVADRISLAQIGQKFAGPALREFLRNPAQRYAHTRMGDFDLSRDEADAVAAFLLDQSLEPAENYEPGDATRGQALVQQNGCINCHALPVPSTMDVPAMQALMQVDWLTGCLAEDAAARGTAPEIPLNGMERDALRALKGAGLESLSQHNKMEFAQRQMHRLSCNACHELGGKRDKWSLLEWQVAHFAAPEPKGEDGTPAIDQSRPSLSRAGEKLRPQWMRALLNGELEQKPRPWLRARMPAYSAAASQGLAEGIAMLHGLSPEAQPLPEPDEELAALGERLVGQRWGFSCTDCHAVGDFPPQNVFGAVGNDFQTVAERLRRDYFHQWMFDPSRIAPRTKMPRYTDQHGYTALTDVLDGVGADQFEAIWQYLLTQPSSEPSRKR